MLYQLGDLLELARRDFEDELVVHLKQHHTIGVRIPKRAVDMDHRDLDQVRRGSLNRRVGGCPFTEGADAEVSLAQLGDISPAAEKCLDVPVLPCELDL